MPGELSAFIGDASCGGALFNVTAVLILRFLGALGLPEFAVPVFAVPACAVRESDDPAEGTAGRGPVAPTSRAAFDGRTRLSDRESSITRCLPSTAAHKGTESVIARVLTLKANLRSNTCRVEHSSVGQVPDLVAGKVRPRTSRQRSPD